MTLFKKVFPSQANPAGVDAAEVDLRKAFTEEPEQAAPLDLDPFAQERLGPEDAAQDDDLASIAAAETDGFCEEADAFGSAADAVHTEADLSLVNETPSAVAETEETVDIEAASYEEAVQSDEEIAACLGRALASDPPETQAVEAETSDTEAEAADGSSYTDADVEAVHAVPEDAPDGDHDPGLDVARFAQEQITALRPVPQPVEANTEPFVTDIEAVPAPATGRAGRRAGRVKTRLLGFNRTGDSEHDPFGQAPEATATAQQEKYPVGWLVIVEGPGVGHSFSLFTGASMIGRGEDQVIRLDFGDTSISRQNHAAIAYDEEQNKFYIGHGGKSNIIRRNARPVLSTEELHHADLIRIGETTLRFVALCGSDFQWNIAGGSDDTAV
ncbi:MAG: FHA domain-containing protein [Roseobacter sp.]